MPGLRGNKVYLRALEPEDLHFVHTVENIEEFWEVSATQTPYSRFMIKQYLENAHRDIYEVKQLRLAICDRSNKVIGFIDLFDFDPVHTRAGIGIMIVSEERGKGYASEALDLVIDYAFNTLNLHQLYSNVIANNKASLELFKKKHFAVIGVKKEWLRRKDSWADEYMLQKINKQ